MDLVEEFLELGRRVFRLQFNRRGCVYYNHQAFAKCLSRLPVYYAPGQCTHSDGFAVGDSEKVSQKTSPVTCHMYFMLDPVLFSTTYRSQLFFI